jgi:cytochrome c peroxidase
MLAGCKNQKQKASIKQDILITIDKLQQKIIDFQKIAQKDSSQKNIQKCFVEVRLEYKQIEWAVEYFIPNTARFINGPALDELEVAENTSFPPNGFQVIEEMIFPKYNSETKTDLLRELTILNSNLKQVKEHLKAITISPDYIFDAIRLEVYRIVSLGITGFDSPIALQSINEASCSLGAIEKVIARSQFSNQESKILEKELAVIIGKAQAYCEKNKDFNTFNRMVFIKEYLNPISKNLQKIQLANNISNVNKNNAINPKLDSFFDKKTFDVNAFIPSKEYTYSEEKVALGSLLFYDNNLSIDKNRSCASCHNPEKAFTDGLKTNVSLKEKMLNRNTPTLTYASLQNALFWDMRQLDLEKQSMDVVTNQDEMHGSFKNIIPIIEKNTAYKNKHQKAFPNAKKVEEWHLQNAIASYVRSLNDFDSRFDQYMRDESNNFSEDEIQGFNLFAGKAKCATCHFIPLFNGTVPPSFGKTEQEVIGTPKDTKGTAISPDLGRYVQYKMPQLKNAFKTPTIRNIALTAPYMHNGVFKTLNEVVDFYNKGGGIGLGFKVENQTLPEDKLNLTPLEKKQLIDFMNTLTDKKNTLN